MSVYRTIGPTLVLTAFYPILFILAGNDDMHESSEEFKIGSYLTYYCGVSFPLASEKIPITYNGEKWCCHFFSAILDQILFILAGNDNIHKSLDEFEIWPDPIRDHRDSCCLEQLKKIDIAPFSCFTVVIIPGK